MSNCDLLTKDERAIATKLGWDVHHVFDLETQKWCVRILPTTSLGGVIHLAKTGNPLATKALRLVMHGAEGKK